MNATGISLNGKSFCTKNRVKVLVDDNATGTQSAVSCGAFVVTNAWFSASGKKPLVTCTNTVISKASIEYGSLKNDNIVRIVPQITQYYLHVQSNGSDRGTATGVEDVQPDDVQCTKVLVDGVLYILRDGHIFNAQGAEIK